MFAMRQPAVAGQFYPRDPEALAREVSRLLGVVREGPALAVVAPHAGYVYSGAIAGATFAQVTVPVSAIVLCPNHTGLGARRSLWPKGRWRLPGGDLEVDEGLAAALAQRAALVADPLAHESEHAVEVQLPFLRARNPSVKVVPLCLAAISSIECVALGEAIAEVVGARPGQVLLVASTDLSHYIPADEARALDGLALARIEAVDPEGLYRVVRESDLSMCGVIPTTVVLAAARALGARRARLVRYGHSGEASGDFSRVVGYAGLVVEPS
jgi:hypothetical protein